MPLQNRVLPTGQIIAHPARGTMTGNRGILHIADRVMGPALWKHRAWICCRLDWQGRRRTLMSGRNWTELFFLDEAVALAAGHRPCAYCRRAAYDRWVRLWARTHGPARAPEMDATLHAARAIPGARRMRHHPVADITTLPDGAFIALGDSQALIHQRALRPYTPEGYGAPQPLRRQSAMLLTPPPSVALLRAGYGPKLHPSLSNGTANA